MTGRWQDTGKWRRFFGRLRGEPSDAVVVQFGVDGVGATGAAVRTVRIAA